AGLSMPRPPRVPAVENVELPVLAATDDQRSSTQVHNHSRTARAEVHIIRKIGRLIRRSERGSDLERLAQLQEAVAVVVGGTGSAGGVKQAVAGEHIEITVSVS